MKTKSNIWTIAAIAIILLIAINLFVGRNSSKNDNFKHQIDSLNKLNDSLTTVIFTNQQEIQRIDSINATLVEEINNAKFRLGELNSTATIYKKMYNEEHSRINNLSNRDLTSEFTSAFD